MKISAFLFFVASAFAQTTPVTVTVTFPTAALIDVLTYNRNVWNDPATVATLSQSIGTTDTTLNVTSTTGYPASGSLAIDSERGSLYGHHGGHVYRRHAPSTDEHGGNSCNRSVSSLREVWG